MDNACAIYLQSVHVCSRSMQMEKPAMPVPFGDLILEALSPRGIEYVAYF